MHCTALPLRCAALRRAALCCIAPLPLRCAACLRVGLRAPSLPSCSELFSESLRVGYGPRQPTVQVCKSVQASFDQGQAHDREAETYVLEHELESPWSRRLRSRNACNPRCHTAAWQSRKRACWLRQVRRAPQWGPQCGPDLASATPLSQSGRVESVGTSSKSSSSLVLPSVSEVEGPGCKACASSRRMQKDIR